MSAKKYILVKSNAGRNDSNKNSLLLSVILKVYQFVNQNYNIGSKSKLSISDLKDLQTSANNIQLAGK